MITPEEAIALLAVFEDSGRRTVHSFTTNGFGADWDEAEVVEFLKSAEQIKASNFAGHGIAAYGEVSPGDKRWRLFETAS